MKTPFFKKNPVSIRRRFDEDSFKNARLHFSVWILTNQKRDLIKIFQTTLRWPLLNQLQTLLLAEQHFESTNIRILRVRFKLLDPFRCGMGLRPIPHRNFQWVSRPISLFLVPLFRNGAKFFLRFFLHFLRKHSDIFSKCTIRISGNRYRPVFEFRLLLFFRI